MTRSWVGGLVISYPWYPLSNATVRLLATQAGNTSGGWAAPRELWN